MLKQKCSKLPVEGRVVF